MDIAIICVGKIKEEFYRNAMKKMSDEINQNHRFQVYEVADEKTPDGASQKEEEKIIQIEGEKIEKFLRPDDHIIALCIEGKQISKEELKKTLTRMQEQSSGRMVFLIGGSLGLWDKLIKKAELKLSFSKMTFPHQLMRVMLTEVICQL